MTCDYGMHSNSKGNAVRVGYLKKHVINLNGIRHQDYQRQLRDIHEWAAKFVAVLVN